MIPKTGLLYNFNDRWNELQFNCRDRLVEEPSTLIPNFLNFTFPTWCKFDAGQHFPLTVTAHSILTPYINPQSRSCV